MLATFSRSIIDEGNVPHIIKDGVKDRLPIRKTYFLAQFNNQINIYIGLPQEKKIIMEIVLLKLDNSNFPF